VESPPGVAIEGKLRMVRVWIIVFKTEPDRWFNLKKLEPEPMPVFLAHWTACADEWD
jgi:hypothetical protein